MAFFYRGALEKSRAEKNCTLYPVPCTPFLAWRTRIMRVSHLSVS